MTSLFWVIWVGWLVEFLFIELPAAIKKTGGTLTETTRSWFSLATHDHFWLVRRVVFNVFMVTLLAHMDMGLPAVPWLVVTGVPFAGVIVGATVSRWRAERKA